MSKGHYFTKREIENVLAKGYYKVSCETYDHMLLELERFKKENYFVKQGYETGPVRGVHSYFLYVKDKTSTNTNKKTNTPEKVSKTVKIKDYKKYIEDRYNKHIKKYVDNTIKELNVTLNTPIFNSTEDDKGGARLGYCSHKSYVYVSKKLLDSGDTEGIDSVIAHEVLHCIVESRGHDKIWKYAMKTFNELSPKIKIHQFSNNTISNNEVLRTSFKYTAVCEKCNKLSLMSNRNTVRVKRYKNGIYKCKCGGKFIYEER